MRRVTPALRRLRTVRALPTASLMLLAGLAGCATTWTPQRGPTAEVLKLTGANDVRVTQLNGNAVVLHRPFVAGDSLIGMEQPDPTGPDILVRRAIALSDVKQLAVREPDGTANTFWIVIGVLVASVAALALACHGDCFGD